MTATAIDPKITATAQTLIAELREGIAKIEARNPVVGTYVLRWDNGLYVGIGEDKKGFACGFTGAAFFGDREAALAWQRRYQIRNGRNEFPSPVIAFNAKQHSIAEAEKLIAEFEGFYGKA